MIAVKSLKLSKYFHCDLNFGDTARMVSHPVTVEPSGAIATHPKPLQVLLQPATLTNTADFNLGPSPWIVSPKNS